MESNITIKILINKKEIIELIKNYSNEQIISEQLIKKKRINVIMKL